MFFNRCNHRLKEIVYYKVKNPFRTLRDFCYWYYEHYVETNNTISSELALNVVRYCSNNWNAIEEGDKVLLEKYCPLLASAQKIFKSTSTRKEDFTSNHSLFLLRREDLKYVGVGYDRKSCCFYNLGVVD